jgi:hypothetical protein
MKMYTWSNDTSILQRIILAKNYESRWEYFVEYCKLRNQGFRDLAFKKLKLFILEAQVWSFENQKEFIISLFELINKDAETDEVFTFPLKQFLTEVLQKWRVSEPSDVRPLRWMGIYLTTGEETEHFLKKAIELGGVPEQAAMIHLTSYYVKGIEFGTHELPSGYCGDLADDQNNFPFIVQLINQIQNMEKKKYLTEQLKYQASLILSWLKNTTNPVDAISTWEKERIKDFEDTVMRSLKSIL